MRVKDELLFGGGIAFPPRPGRLRGNHSSPLWRQGLGAGKAAACFAGLGFVVVNLASDDIDDQLTKLVGVSGGASSCGHCD